MLIVQPKWSNPLEKYPAKASLFYYYFKYLKPKYYTVAMGK